MKKKWERKWKNTKWQEREENEIQKKEMTEKGKEMRERKIK